MTNTKQTYTYRCGKKVILTKQANQFVVRKLPEQLKDFDITDTERMSPASTRVTVSEAKLEQLMSRSRDIAPTHHAYHIADTDEEFLITDRIFVTFKDPLSSEQVDAFAGKYGLVLLEKYADRNYLFQLTDHTGMNPVKLVVKLTEDEPLVEMSDHDLNYRTSTYALTLPTDPSYHRQWHLHARFNHDEVDPRSSARCEEAWQLLDNFGSPDVVVGVTDDGCKLDHVDFNSPGKFAGWGYFRGSRLIKQGDVDADPNQMHKPGSNHGTSCAGVIAGEVDAMLTVGAAPGCQLLPIQWESEGPSLFISDSKMLTALDYMADKVDVISNSWGHTPVNNRAPILRDRIAALAQSGGRRGKGIIFLWAAGNENCLIQHNASVDVPFTNGWSRRPDGSFVWVGVQTSRFFENNLTDVPGVMHIAALASTTKRSHYSNYGTGITLCAPTSNSHKYFRLSVSGLGITTTTGAAGGVTDRFGGTSSATPLVAGVAALVISANPELAALQVISILKQTASKNLNMEGYLRTPPANFNPDTSWDVSPISPFNKGDFTDIGDPDGSWSPWFGHGSVNAAAAVAKAISEGSGDVTGMPKYSSTPNSAIPDNDPNGLQDIIQAPDTGRVQSIRVDLDITHTWIGDLSIQLVAPNGTRATLHNRAGGSSNNIKQTYSMTTLPSLAIFKGITITGDWTLHIQDLAGSDVGTLNKWTLEIGLSVEPVVVEDTTSAQIPDNDPNGITRNLEFPNEHTIRDIAVSVDITHTWIGDLQVSVIPPNNAPIFLHNRSGRSADNLVRTWRSQDLPELQALRGQEAGGTWMLHVADLAGRDVGKLNRWKIEVAK